MWGGRRGEIDCKFGKGSSVEGGAPGIAGRRASESLFRQRCDTRCQRCQRESVPSALRHPLSALPARACAVVDRSITQWTMMFRGESLKKAARRYEEV